MPLYLKGSIKKMAGYSQSFAKYYDSFTEDVNYPAKARYFSKIIQHFKDRCELVLDLACGTGSLAIELSRLGYDVIAADGSPEMLSCACAKAQNETNPPLFLCQDMTELDLYGSVDAAICMLDSLNHLAELSQIAEVFRRLYNFVSPGGLFIFDMNTPYKHAEILSGQTFVFEHKDCLALWRNSLADEKGTVDISLDFFERSPSGLYIREKEEFSEYSYNTSDIVSLLEKFGFELLEMYGDYNTDTPSDNEQRIVYVSKRKDISNG